MKLFVIFSLFVSLVHGNPEPPRYDAVHKSTSNTLPPFSYYNNNRTEENAIGSNIKEYITYVDGEKSHGGENIRNGDINIMDGAYTEVSPSSSNNMLLHYIPVSQSEKNEPAQPEYVLSQTSNSAPTISALYNQQKSHNSSIGYKVSALQTVYNTPDSQIVYTVPVSQSINNAIKHQIAYPVSQTESQSASSQINYRALAPQKVSAAPRDIYSFAALYNTPESKSSQRNAPESKNLYTVVSHSKYNNQNQQNNIKPVQVLQDYQTVYSSVAEKLMNKQHGFRVSDPQSQVMKTIYSAPTTQHVYRVVPPLTYSSSKAEIIYGTPAQTTTNNAQSPESVYFSPIIQSEYKSEVPQVVYSIPANGYNTSTSKTTYAVSMPHAAPQIAYIPTTSVYNTPTKRFISQHEYKSSTPQNIYTVSSFPAAQNYPSPTGTYAIAMPYFEYMSPQLVYSIPSSSAMYTSPTYSSPSANVVYNFLNTQTSSKLPISQVVYGTLAPQKEFMEQAQIGEKVYYFVNQPTLNSQEYFTQDSIQNSKPIYYVS